MTSSSKKQMPVIDVAPIRNESKAFIIADTLDNLMERLANFISLNGFYTDKQVEYNKKLQTEREIAELAVVYKQLGLKEKELEKEVLNMYKNK